MNIDQKKKEKEELGKKGVFCPDVGRGLKVFVGTNGVKKPGWRGGETRGGVRAAGGRGLDCLAGVVQVKCLVEKKEDGKKRGRKK